GSRLGGIGRAQSQPGPDRRVDAERSHAQSCVLRHLVGRSREVCGGDARGDDASREHPESLPGPLSVRDRHRGTGKSGTVLRGLRPVDAGLAAVDERRQSQSSQGQLRADLRCRSRTSTRLGTGKRALNDSVGERETTMRPPQMKRHASGLWLLIACLSLGAPSTALAQNEPGGTGEAAGGGAQEPPPKITVQAQSKPRPSLEVYGFVMLDFGGNFTTINPNWFDTMRVTRLPTFEDQFGKDGSTFAGVRQTRFGARSTTPTDLGDLKTTFEFELFGTGVDEGQTTFRLRHAYGELGHFGAGQYWSPFMDIDVFPNSLEYWGPTGMVFFRNVQVRWMPIQGDTRLTLALERPGASGDAGVLADRIELQNVRGRSPIPDFSGEYRFGRPWGYVEAAGLLGWIKWDDILDDQF